MTDSGSIAPPGGPERTKPTQPGQDPVSMALGLLLGARANLDAAIRILTPAPEPEEEGECPPHVPKEIETMGSVFRFCKRCGEALAD